AVEAVDQAGAAVGPDPSAVGVVAVGLRAAGSQAVAVVEPVGHTALVGQVALHVIAQADHRGAAAAGGLDVGQAPVAVIAIGVVARLGAGADLDLGQVVEHVVAVAGGAEHRRGGLDQPVQAVVGHVPVAALVLAGRRIGDERDIAVLVVGNLVLVDRGRPVGVAADL